METQNISSLECEVLPFLTGLVSGFSLTPSLKLPPVSQSLARPCLIAAVLFLVAHKIIVRLNKLQS